MNINCVNSTEIMNTKLVEKQTKVLAQIDNKLKGLFLARLSGNPMEVNLDTDDQVATRINELLVIKKLCVNLESFGLLDQAELDVYRIDYSAD